MAKKMVKKKNIGKNNVPKWLYWTPRILSIIFILFMAIFSFDVFDENLGFWGTILGLFMHNLPSLILIIFLIIAWKREWVGAAGFFLFALWYVTFILQHIQTSGFQGYYLIWFLTIAGPAILVGILFLIGWNKKKN